MYSRGRILVSFFIAGVLIIGLVVTMGMMFHRTYADWKNAPSFRKAVNEEKIGKITLIRIGSETILDSVGSKYSVLAESILGSEQIAIWTVTEGGRIPVRDSDWLVLDTVEIRRAEGFTAPPGFVGIEVRTLD